MLLINPFIQGNSVAGLAFFQSFVTILNGTLETNGSGASTIVVDSKTIKKSSIHLDDSHVSIIDMRLDEATVDPAFVIDNDSVLTLHNFAGYGPQSGLLVDADDTSGVVLSGYYGPTNGIVQNVLAWPDMFIPNTSPSILIGVPVYLEDPSINAFYAEQLPNFTASGASPPTVSTVEDDDLGGICRQVIYSSSAGDTNTNRASVNLGAGSASKDNVYSILLKSDADTDLATNFHDGTNWNVINTQNIHLIANKVTRIVASKKNIPANGNWLLYFWPVSTDAPTIKFSRLQLYQGDQTEVASNAISRIVKYGAFDTSNRKTFQAFTDADDTPSVAGYINFKTANTGATTITDFDDGFDGQTIKVIINDANTTIDFTASGLKGNAGADWSPTTGDHMTCTYDGTDWFCDVSDNTA
jgi:hypothetical protein